MRDRTAEIANSKRSLDAVRTVVDTEHPWKLPRLKDEFWKYPYTKTADEWKALLVRGAQGNAEAEFEIASNYDDGCKDPSGRILVRRSARKAVEWYRRSAEHGDASAENNLGVLLGNGKGVERDPKEALIWLKKAFRQGSGCAAPNIAITYRENGHFRQAVHWFKKSVESEDDGALIQLGVHYYWGMGVRRDHIFAVRCFQKATRGKNLSESDRDDAFFYLAIPYLEGKGVKKSIHVARKFLERSNIDNDHPAARRLLDQIRKMTD